MRVSAPHHPISALAKQRITELSIRRAAIQDGIRAAETRQRDALRPHEVETMLEDIPDLCSTLKAANPEELTDILTTLDITATYDGQRRPQASRHHHTTGDSQP